MQPYKAMLSHQQTTKPGDVKTNTETIYNGIYIWKILKRMTMIEYGGVFG
jgi:hypothetical protein